MVPRLLWIALALAGCGRIGFGSEAARDGGGDAAVGDAAGDAAADAAPGDAAGDAPAGSVTETFGDAPGTTHPNTIRETYITAEPGQTGFNYGADDELRIERDANERGLIAFDLQAIPTTATVVSATLTVTVTDMPLTASQLSFHPMLETWQEGTQEGSVGVPNYLARTAALPWSNPGAGPPSSSSATAAFQITPVLGRATYDLPAAVVQAWVADPAANLGLLIVTNNDDSTRFDSSESDPSTDRPVLGVTYVP